MFKENILEEMKMKRKNILKKFESISVCSALNYFYDISEKTVDWLAQYSIKANAITLGGLFFAVLGVNFLAMEYYFSALVCLLLNRWCDVLDGISARRQEITAFGAFFDIAADYLSLGLFIFGFALAAPADNAVAGSFMLLALCFSAAVLLGLAIVSGQNYRKLNRSKLKICLWGSIQNFDVSLALVLMCLVPAWFMPLALFFGLISLVKSLLLVSSAYYNLVIAARRTKRK